MKLLRENLIFSNFLETDKKEKKIFFSAQWPGLELTTTSLPLDQATPGDMG